MPTTIDIEITSIGCMEADDRPFPGKTFTTYRLTTNIKPASFYEHHLGFRASMRAKPKVKQRDLSYSLMCMVEPFCHTHMRIAPFNLIISNIGDGQLRVSLRLPRGMQDVMLAALQDGKQVYQAKAYQTLDANIYYATLVFDASVTIHIEELSTGDYDTQPLAEGEH
jgi:hypothetical protein